MVTFDTTLITPELVFGLLMIATFGAVKYAEQTWGNNPAKWSWKKYAQVFVAALAVGVTGFILTGTMDVATIDQINQWLTPALSFVGATILSLYGVKYTAKVVENKSLTNSAPAPVTKPTGATVGSTAATYAATGNDGISPEGYGVEVLPGFQEGKSPYIAVVTMKCSESVKEWFIDWMDGSATQNGKFIHEGEYFIQTVAHQYVFEKGIGAKYDSHTFYPMITIVGLDGDKKILNVEGTTANTGRAVSICVNA
jgi:hypothetical protein